MSDRVFCDREFLRRATEIYLENAHCVYASTRAPQDRLTGGPGGSAWLSPAPAPS